ncbi:Uncharacterised protein [Chlamydia trachomatis]|nr:Uncharacterised protein [Chlamydia trachomatis]
MNIHIYLYIAIINCRESGKRCYFQAAIFLIIKHLSVNICFDVNAIKNHIKVTEYRIYIILIEMCTFSNTYTFNSCVLAFNGYNRATRRFRLNALPFMCTHVKVFSNSNNFAIEFILVFLHTQHKSSELSWCGNIPVTSWAFEK